MQAHRVARTIICTALLATFVLVPHARLAAQQTAATAAKPGELTVDRIYSQPSLSGRLTRGITWSPDGKQLSFFESTGAGKEAKVELSSMNPATGDLATGSDLGGADSGGLTEFASGWGALAHGHPTAVTFGSDGRLYLADDWTGTILWMAPLNL